MSFFLAGFFCEGQFPLRRETLELVRKKACGFFAPVKAFPLVKAAGNGLVASPKLQGTENPNPKFSLPFTH
jgi:hypothetical protein